MLTAEDYEYNPDIIKQLRVASINPNKIPNLNYYDDVVRRMGNKIFSSQFIFKRFLRNKACLYNFNYTQSLGICAIDENGVCVDTIENFTNTFADGDLETYGRAFAILDYTKEPSLYYMYSFNDCENVENRFYYLADINPRDELLSFISKYLKIKYNINVKDHNLRNAFKKVADYYTGIFYVCNSKENSWMEEPGVLEFIWSCITYSLFICFGEREDFNIDLHFINRFSIEIHAHLMCWISYFINDFYEQYIEYRKMYYRAISPSYNEKKVNALYDEMDYMIDRDEFFLNLNIDSDTQAEIMDYYKNNLLEKCFEERRRKGIYKLPIYEKGIYAVSYLQDIDYVKAGSDIPYDGFFIPYIICSNDHNIGKYGAAKLSYMINHAPIVLDELSVTGVLYETLEDANIGCKNIYQDLIDSGCDEYEADHEIANYSHSIPKTKARKELEESYPLQSY